MNFERYKYHIRGGGVKREQALSEVIGFLMIIALLGILFSMYLLYVVPIQGKDAEISHMKYVSQQFIDLKSDIDSLIINERVNVPIARSFELGTLASTGQGALSILPIQGFSEAAGTLVVNQQMDFLNVTGQFLINNNTAPPEISFIERPNNAQPVQWVDNGHLYVSYPANYLAGDNYTVTVNVSHINTTYTVVDNYTKTTVYDEPYGYFKIHSKTNNQINQVIRAYPLDPYWFDPQKFIDSNIISWVMNTTLNATFNNTTDYLTVKNEKDIILDFYNSTMSNPASTLLYTRTLQKNATNNFHIFDLSKINEIISTDPTKMIFELEGVIPVGYGEPEWKLVNQPSQPLGSLQYRSQNRYWINQELLYEMGGLFLKQNEGVSIMLIPSLSVTPVDTPDGPNIRVSLVDVTITDTNDVSGSKSAQIFAKVDSVTKNQLRELDGGEIKVRTISSGVENAKFLVITFTPQNVGDVTTTRLWKRAFDQVYVITQKTMSERGVTYEIANSMITYYDDNPEKLSSSLIIGDNIVSHLAGIGEDAGLQAYIDRLTACANDLSADHSGAGHAGCISHDPLRPFFFDYSKARVSLVIQSGAL